MENLHQNISGKNRGNRHNLASYHPVSNVKLTPPALRRETDHAGVTIQKTGHTPLQQ